MVRWFKNNERHLLFLIFLLGIMILAFPITKEVMWEVSTWICTIILAEETCFFVNLESLLHERSQNVILGSCCFNFVVSQIPNWKFQEFGFGHKEYCFYSPWLNIDTIYDFVTWSRERMSWDWFLFCLYYFLCWRTSRNYEPGTIANSLEYLLVSSIS